MAAASRKASASISSQIGDYLADVDAAVIVAQSRDPGLRCSCSVTAPAASSRRSTRSNTRTKLAGFICESFAFQVAAPDFALAVVKGLSHLAPHLHVLRLKNEEFSRDPAVVGR